MDTKVFNESVINQFQVIYELIASDDFRGNKGLLMRATWKISLYISCLLAMFSKIIILISALRPF